MRRAALLALAFALGGCASTPAAPKAPAVPPLLDGAALGGARSASQVVRSAFADRELTLLAAVQVEANVVSVVGVDTLGRRVFSISYDGQNVTAETDPSVPAGFSPQHLLADVELALWPLKALQAAYAGTGWSVAEPYPGTRRLRRDGRLVAEVHYTGADPWLTRHWIANLQLGYVLGVEPQPAAR